jgi:hypothetical protein
MHETIRVNACDENNWSDKSTVESSGNQLPKIIPLPLNLVCLAVHDVKEEHYIPQQQHVDRCSNLTKITSAQMLKTN